ncbi:MAG: T9SS type A sorting domain-containing protein, partial [Ignavibacterium sp.]|nr:T9SS type A sorting domain-containing protein [Ignavibacterium sp.]
KVYYRLKQIDYNGQFVYTREVEVDLSSIVDNYSLSQNYPNPFNPSTKIRFTLPFDSNVKLTIYNIAGEMIKEIVNGNFRAGEHEVTVSLNDIKGAASGIYIYSINAVSNDGQRTFNQTKKMVLLK